MAKDYLGADNNKVLPRFRHAIDEEASELSDFARALRARIQAWPGVFDRPINDLNTILQAAPSRAEAETALEACGRRLRRRWLDAASSAPIETIAPRQTRSLRRPQLGSRRTLAMSGSCNRPNWSAAVARFSVLLHTAGMRITRYFRAVRRQWLECWIFWKLLSPWGLRTHYAPRILAHTSRRPRSLLCFLRCCM
jgi:hypothetical protein